MMEPMRITEVLHPLSIANPKPGMYLVDFGQNLYGAVRLKVAGPRGSTVRIRTAYSKKPDGTLKTEDNRSARSTDVYVLKGQGQEVWQPRFRGQGTRHAEITGFPGVPKPENCEFLVMHTDMERVGHFECSNRLLNQIYANVVRSMRMQNRSVPMEPDRDERMPWLGHPAKTSESEAYVFGVAPFYRNFLAETRNHQRPDGLLSDSGYYWAFYTRRHHLAQRDDHCAPLVSSVLRRPPHPGRELRRHAPLDGLPSGAKSVAGPHDEGDPVWRLGRCVQRGISGAANRERLRCP